MKRHTGGARGGGGQGEEAEDLGELHFDGYGGCDVVW